MDYPPEAEHHGLLRETVRRFVETEVPRELARKWDRENEIDRGVLYKLADLGLFGITIPEHYGGSGRDITATMIVIEELCRRSTALGSGYIYGACYAGMNLVDTASEDQRQEWLPKVARGEMLFSYGLTEPDVGSDLASVATTAVRDGDVVRINGAKRFCSGTTYTD
ncbi:MAG: acyl-CoA dehydrogenase, partial [Acidimicrobiia bacterium]|nr:acyl-CoA dehydrogenase [Acidimicrobiia bacterium]